MCGVLAAPMNLASSRLVAAILGAALLVGSFAGCSRHPLKIESARRTLRYNQGGSVVMVRNQQQDVFLIIEMKDLPAEVFAKVRDGQPYFKAGEQRFEVHYSQAVESSTGERKILLAAVVPRDVTEFALHVGDYPPREFDAERDVHDSLHI